MDRAAETEDAFSEEAMRLWRARPDFRDVIDDMARDCVAFFLDLDPEGRWLLADLGRTAIYTAALILDSGPEGLSVAALVGLTAYGAFSRGRILAFVDRALSAGEFRLAPGDAPWNRRRLAVSPAFVERLRRRAAVEVRAACRLDPELCAAGDPLAQDALFRRFLFFLGLFSTQERVRAQGASPARFFLEREGGGRMLMAFAAAQPPGRETLLEAAEVSRAALARTCWVSRAHVQRTLDAAREAGLIRFEGERLIRFAPALSQDLERTVAFTLQMTRQALASALAA